jgi:DNA-binding HxlR family transcriptional regulator
MGKKFTVLILLNLIFSNQAQFNKMLDSIEEINTKTLSLRLKEMEKDGLVDRKICHKNYS